jgi:hypothetical protein
MPERGGTLFAMSQLDERLRAVLMASVQAHRVPNAEGDRSPLLHLRMGGMRQGTDHHAWPDTGPAVDREDLQDLAELGLVEVTPQTNSSSFRPTAVGYKLAGELGQASQTIGPRDTAQMGVPSRRAFLLWFHELEDDAGRSESVRDGFQLIQAARADGVIDAQDVDAFAKQVLEMADVDLIDFDHMAREIDQFGLADPSRDLQQATDLRSTAKERDWMRQNPTPSSSISFGEGATVGQVAGGDITNYVTFSQVLAAAETELGRISTDAGEREEARNFLRALGGDAKEIATGAGANVAARALAAALGLPA